MDARLQFLEGMRGFRLARKHPDLVEKMPTDHEHNLRASILRNGIAVIGFSILEHFIRERTGEILQAFGRVRVPFDELPSRLQSIATIGAIRGVSFRQKFHDDPTGFTQAEASVIASSLGTRYQISKYSVGWDNSNLSIKDVDTIFSAFGIDGGWTIVDAIAKRLDLSIPSAKESFKNAADRRHNAAHNVATVIQPSHLEAYDREAYAIAVGFDMVMTKAYQRVYEADRGYLDEKVKITLSDIATRIVKHVHSKWKEFVEGKRRAVRAADTRQAVWLDARRRAKANGEFLTCIDADGFPCEWEFPGLP